MLLSLLLSIVSSPSYTHEQLGRSFLRPLFQPALENNAAYFLYPEWQTASQLSSANFSNFYSLSDSDPLFVLFLFRVFFSSFLREFSSWWYHLLDDLLEIKTPIFCLSTDCTREERDAKRIFKTIKFIGVSLLIIVIVREILSFLELLRQLIYLFLYFLKIF